MMPSCVSLEDPSASLDKIGKSSHFTEIVEYSLIILVGHVTIFG